MSTAWSHVLNCKLYKVLAMKIDDLRSTVVGAKDIDGLHLENKQLRSMLSVSKDLTEALAELAKAKELLAKLGASDYADTKGSAETRRLVYIRDGYLYGRLRLN
ncbi:hypothetical protein Fot_19769 [Forsythia ovata]|uniref:Uncharacterized protein n=1 Tax=Forsythia ovata TaxID=205694 RepID=A0ABD1VM37_9LAMI